MTYLLTLSNVCVCALCTLNRLLRFCYSSAVRNVNIIPNNEILMALSKNIFCDVNPTIFFIQISTRLPICQHKKLVNFTSIAIYVYYYLIFFQHDQPIVKFSSSTNTYTAGILFYSSLSCPLITTRAAIA